MSARPSWISVRHTSVNVYGLNGFVWPGRGACPIRALVIHVADGSYEGSISWAANPQAEASFSFIIAKDGRVAEVVDPWGGLAPWANGISDPAATALPPNLVDLARPPITTNANWVTVSIELEGKPFEAGFPTQAQYQAVGLLGAWICQRASLTPRAGQTIVPHTVFDTRGRPNCCGPQVDLARIEREIQQQMTPTPPPPPSSSVAVGPGIQAALDRMGDTAITPEQYHHAVAPLGEEVSIVAGQRSLYVWVKGAGVYVVGRHLFDAAGNRL